MLRNFKRKLNKTLTRAISLCYHGFIGKHGDCDMKTHYFNIWSKKDGFFCESSSMTYEDALEDITDHGDRLYYAYTLEVSEDKVCRLDLQGKAYNQLLK